MVWPRGTWGADAKSTAICRAVNKKNNALGPLGASASVPGLVWSVELMVNCTLSLSLYLPLSRAWKQESSAGGYIIIYAYSAHKDWLIWHSSSHITFSARLSSKREVEREGEMDERQVQQTRRNWQQILHAVSAPFLLWSRGRHRCLAWLYTIFLKLNYQQEFR